MTTYLISTSGLNSVSLSVAAGSSEIRIPNITISYSASSYGGAGEPFPVSTAATLYYIAAGVTGGSTASIVPMRQNSPASTAIAKAGATAGANPIVLEGFGAAGAGSIVGNWVFQPGFDLILSPGGTAIYALGSGSNNGMSMDFYFEELRLSWPS